MGAPLPLGSVPAPSVSTQSVQRRVIVASQDPADADWLQMRVGAAVQVTHCTSSIDAVLESLKLAASAVIVVFDARGDLSSSAQVVQWLKKHQPEVVVLGMGYTSSAQVPLAALRSGVKDFLDISSSNVEDVRRPVWDACMRGVVEREPTFKGKVVALVGARAGMGVTTLAIHLSAALCALQDQMRSTASKAYELVEQDLGVGLMDLGFPLRDGQMLLGLNARFHMVDAVQGVNRLDRAMLEATLPRHTCGTSVLSWPAQSHVLREVSPLSTASMIQRLRGYFSWQVVDVGGFPSSDVVHELIAEADLVWVVCDQSIGGIVSTSDWLKGVRSASQKLACDGLIVSRAFKSQGLPAADIAKRMELALVQTLPNREEALLKSSSAGLLLSESAPSDPYVQAVKQIALDLWKDAAGAQAMPVDGRKGWMRRLLGAGRAA